MRHRAPYTFNSPTLFSHSGTYNEPSKNRARRAQCWERENGKVKRSKNAQGVREHEKGKGDLQQKMRHSQKTKGAPQPFRNNTVKSIPVFITAQMLQFGSWISDELYRLSSLHQGPVHTANNGHKDLNLTGEYLVVKFKYQWIYNKNFHTY